MELDGQAQNLCSFPQEYIIFDNIGLLAAKFTMHKRTWRDIFTYFFYIHEVEWIELSQSKLNHYYRLHHQLEITRNLYNQIGTNLPHNIWHFYGQDLNSFSSLTFCFSFCYFLPFLFCSRTSMDHPNSIRIKFH